MLTPLTLIKHPIYLKKLMAIRAMIYTRISKLNVSVATDKEPFPPEAGEYRRIRRGSWGKAFTCAQFFVEGKIPQGKNREKLAVLADIGGEGQLYDREGNPLVGITNRVISAIDLFQAHKGKTYIDIKYCSKEDDIRFYIDAGYNGATLLINPYGISKFKGVYLVEEDKEAKAFYYDCLTLSYGLFAQNSSTVKQTLFCAMDAFLNGGRAVASASVKPLLALLPKTGINFYTFGHAHLDLAWLWPVRETKRKSARTFSNQLENLRKYPNFIYGAGQAQQYDWMKTLYPQFFERIKGYIAEKRIEIQGALWTECDMNLPSGESIIRQIYYGQKFWRDNFGVTSNICWLPDVFGYNGNLPQILKKSGIDNFMTIKLSWNEHNKFPYNTFLWSGIDKDNTVAVHMPPSGNYLGSGTPLCFKVAKEKNKEKELDKALFLFGAGDGGGGPSEAQLEMISRQAAAKTGVNFCGAEKFFEDLKADYEKLPAHSGELYLEKHQGTFTTQCKTKKYNRTAEALLRTAESVWTDNYIRSGAYPEQELEEIWKEILLYQFHDIIPGSSINRVYRECEERYAVLTETLRRLIRESCANSEKENTTYLNTSPLTYDKDILMDGKCYRFCAQPYATAPLVEITEKSDAFAFCEKAMENRTVRLQFASDGSIVQYENKENGKKFGVFNQMRIYKDPPSYYNAWDIRLSYLKKRKKGFQVVQVSTEVVGSLLVRRQLLQCGKSYIKQTIVLSEEGEAVRIDNVALLNRRFKMLRMDAQPVTWSDNVACEIQFGRLARSTKNQTSVEKAQYEICAHKYIDLNDGKNGIAFLNDCKYGYRVKEGTVSINLIRNPVHPDTKADRGEQTFNFIISPYTGDFADSGLLTDAYALNSELIAVGGEKKTLISVDGGIVAETVKKGVREGTVAVRLYEPSGKGTECRFQAAFPYLSVSESNLMEENMTPISGQTLTFSPFEIKTLIFELAKEGEK